MLLVKCSQRGSLVPRKLSSPLLSLSPDPFLHVRLTVQITRATPPPSHEHRAERSPCPAARRGKATRREKERERSKERKIRTCGIICYVAKWGWTPVGRPRFYLNSLNSRLSFASRSNTRSLHRPEPFIALVNSERKKKNLLLLTPIVKSPIVNLANSLANRILVEAMEKARERESAWHRRRYSGWGSRFPWTYGQPWQKSGTETATEVGSVGGRYIRA